MNHRDISRAASSAPWAIGPAAGAATAPGRRPPPIGRRPARRRVLDARRITRTLGPAPVPTRPACIDVIDDLSGSMFGGNDVTGLRHEALLIALELLARSRRIGRTPAWTAQLRSFDLDSPLDFERTALDRRTVGQLPDRLLAPPMGGSSNLGPALATVDADRWAGRRALVVMSDFELFDADVPGVLRRLEASSADQVLALVFSSPAPAQLTAGRVQVVEVQPGRDEPEAVAAAVVDVAHRLAPSTDRTR